jgi:hypothetical protein
MRVQRYYFFFNLPNNCSVFFEHSFILCFLREQAKLLGCSVS